MWAWAGDSATGRERVRWKDGMSDLYMACCRLRIIGSCYLTHNRESP